MAFLLIGVPLLRHTEKRICCIFEWWSAVFEQACVHPKLTVAFAAVIFLITKKPPTNDSPISGFFVHRWLHITGIANRLNKCIGSWFYTVSISDRPSRASIVLYLIVELDLIWWAVDINLHVSATHLLRHRNCTAPMTSHFCHSFFVHISINLCAAIDTAHPLDADVWLVNHYLPPISHSTKPLYYLFFIGAVGKLQHRRGIAFVPNISS